LTSDFRAQGISLADDFLDDVFARLVVWMCLARVHDLETPGFTGECLELCRITQQQAGPLVGRRAAGEADSERLGVKV